MLAILLFFMIIYLYTTRNHSYWSKRNIKYDTPLPLFGNNFYNVFGLKSITTISIEYYNKYPEEKLVGFFNGARPELIVRDPEIIKNILITDFVYFHRRGFGRDTKKEPLLQNLFNVDGDTWKLLRQRLTPAFTSAKLKNMFPLIIKCAETFISQGEDIVAKGGDCDIRDLMARFTTDVTGACGLGIEMDTINNENSIFRKIGKEIFHRSITDCLLFGLWEIFPELRRILYIFNYKSEKVFLKLVTKVFEERNYKPSERNDFVDLLLDLATKGKIIGESIEERHPDGSPKVVEMDMDLMCMAAQVFIFFAAGFETTSSSTSYTLHELAYHPDVQQKIQKEIDEIMSKYNNKLCYESIAEMTLLDKAYKEALRIFPPVGTLHRVCVRKYNIPHTDVTIDPGVRIIIPVQAIQNDPKYFNCPDKFHPERFEATMKQKFAFLPFGEGPRACIGSRLGHMQSLAGLAAVLHKFSVEPSHKTRRKLQVNPRVNVVQSFIDGVPLKLTLRKNNLF